MAGPKLYAARFEQDDSSAALLEQFDNVESVGIDWDVYDFGVTRIEVTVKANGPYDAYDRYDTQLGQRLAIYGADLYRPISGWIYEAEWLPGDRIRYTAYGPNWRCRDFRINRRYPSTDDIQTAMTYTAGRTAIINTSAGSFTANTTTLGGWNPHFPDGDYPDEIFRILVRMSDSSFRLYDFRLVDEPLNSTSLKQFEPYYTYRDSTASADWVVSRKDLSRLSLSRNISEFANIVRVWYGLVTGTATTATATTITYSMGTFITSGVKPGDTLTNLTEGGRTKIVSVNSQTSVTHEGWRPKWRGVATGGSTTSLTDTEADFVNDGVLTGDILTNIVDGSTGTITAVAATTLTIGGAMSGGLSNDAGERYEVTGSMSNGDSFAIETEGQINYAEHQIDAGDLWNNEIQLVEPRFNATQAAQLAQALVTVTPQQVQSFVVSSPYIRDGNGAKRPLWDVIANGGGYIQVEDLYPAASQFSDAINSLTTFWITGMSYDYTTNSLTVDVDNLSRRLDARLRRARILTVQQIRRY